jgi:hypothetical protein
MYKDKCDREPKNKCPSSTFKYCSRCKQLLSTDKFYKTKIDGEICILGWCKNCRKQIARKRTKENRRNGWLRQKYGLSTEIFNNMLISQAGKCAICGTTNPGGKVGDSFSVDHNHTTGQIRGLLCQTCNQMLGLMQDSAKNLRKAAAYINYWEKKDE